MVFTKFLSLSLLLVSSRLVLSGPLQKRCFDDSAWDLTTDNYQKANVDEWLQSWWSEQTDKTSDTVPNMLIKQFVKGNHGLSCPSEVGGTNDCTNSIDCTGKSL
jgi:hypothetical protein